MKLLCVILIASSLAWPKSRTIVAVDGDGTSCSINKIASAMIAVSISCKSADGLTTWKGPLYSQGTTARFATMSFGDIACGFGINPTTVAVPFGSLGSIPPSSVGWQCSLEVRSGGPTGNIVSQTIVSGSLSWP